MCQIKNISEMGKESFSIKLKIHLVTILRRIIRILELGLATALRRLLTLEQEKKDSGKKGSKDSLRRPSLGLKAGDVVKIRSKEKILQTLDKNGTLGGCGFMEEMRQYCGSQHKVLKRVDYFFDERNSRFLKARNIVLLEGLHCSGNLSESMPKCDRLCFFFWREEWLEKIN